MTRDTLGVLLVLGSLALPWRVHGGDPEQSFLGIPAEYQDRGFAQFASPSLIGEAWHKQDAALLADAGLALAEGERVLLRTSKVLPAEVVLRLAIALAGEQGDQATLARLMRADTVTRNAKLAPLTAAAHKKAAEQGLTVVAVNHGASVTAELLFEAFRQDVREARLTNDAKTFSVLRGISADLPGLSVGQRQRVAEWVKGDVDGTAEPARIALRYSQLAYQAEQGKHSTHFLRTNRVLEQLLVGGKGTASEQVRELYNRLLAPCQPNDPSCD